MNFKDIVVSEEYTTKSGDVKKKYINIGTVFVYDDGGMSIKLDLIPLNWDGKAAIYDKKPREQQGNYQSAPQNNHSQPAPSNIPEINMDDDMNNIPF